MENLYSNNSFISITLNVINQFKQDLLHIYNFQGLILFCIMFYYLLSIGLFFKNVPCLFF